MKIAIATISIWTILIGVLAIIIGCAILGWCLIRMLRNIERTREEEERIYYEEWEASDGKKYLWPIDHPRSSRNQQKD
jgi:hypothetical protein